MLFILLVGVALASCNSQTIDALEQNRAFVAQMGVGWNLGNTFDAKGPDETAWRNPFTTKEMIDMVADKGFKTLRIPITWQFHLGAAPDYTIEEAWLDRVETVVNYGLQNDMFVIVNIHHDEDIIEPSYSREEESTKIIVSIWEQVSERFKNYDNSLIFETLNEMRIPGGENEWKGGTEEGRQCLNNFHAAAVEAIRASGGNNATRKIMLSTFAASGTDIAMEGLELPKDDNILAAVHCYTPYDFCQRKDNPNLEWGTQEEQEELDNLFAHINDVFSQKGYAVVMGEWGSKNNNNDEQRAIHAAYYTKTALKHNICPVVWDDGGQFQLLDRHNLSWKREGIADAIVGAVK